jgi:hypothetical protein
LAPTKDKLIRIADIFHKRPYPLFLPVRAITGRPVPMPRKKDPDEMTAREHIADVLQWAERQGFQNIAAALRRALDLLNIESKRRS